MSDAVAQGAGSLSQVTQPNPKGSGLVEVTQPNPKERASTNPDPDPDPAPNPEPDPEPEPRTPNPDPDATLCQGGPRKLRGATATP